MRLTIRWRSLRRSGLLTRVGRAALPDRSGKTWRHQQPGTDSPKNWLLVPAKFHARFARRDELVARQPVVSEPTESQCVRLDHRQRP